MAVGEGKIDKIILFGSYARGDWVKDMYVEDHITYSYESDLDLFFDIHLSESSVGRELTKLIAAGKITKSASAARVKRKRKFVHHAKKWKYGMKAREPGQLVQIDHMSVRKHEVNMKEFRAWDPVTKTIVADVVSNATSAAAAKFLQKKVIKEIWSHSSTVY